jgi:drug/metabolite transporter (DMT)-like permease
VLAVLLSLSCSLVWGVGDYLGGLQTRRNPVVAVMAISQTAGLLGVVLALVLHGEGPPPLLDLWPAAVAGLLGLCALSAFYYALAVGTISIVAPIAATSAAVPVIAGIVLGERPGPLQGAGLLAALVGVVLASREPGAHPVQGAARRAVPLALAAALLLGLGLIALHGARDSDLLWVLVTARATSVPVLLLGCLILRPTVVRATVPVMLVIGVADTAATGLFVAATTFGPLAVVSVLSSLYPVVTVGLAQLRLGERIGRVQGAGVALALLGVCVLTATA